MTPKLIQPAISAFKIDSLGESLSKLQSHTDSLQAIVNKTEIGQGYFDKIIYLQLTIFIVIITIILGIVSVISWKAIIVPFRKTAEEIRAEMNLLISSQKNEFDRHKLELENKFKILNQEQGIIARQAMRGIFFSLDKDESACVWALRLADSYYEVKDMETTSDWIFNAVDTLKYLSVGVVSEFSEEIVKLLEKLKLQVNSEADKQNLEKILKEVYKVKYSLIDKV